MAHPAPHHDPEVRIWRNGTYIMNIAHFAPGMESLERQTQARELLQSVYNAPYESQATLIGALIEENEEAIVPYLFYEAVKTGHVDVAEAIKQSGKLALQDFAGGWGDAVEKYQEDRNKEVLGAGLVDKETVLAKWLEEFQDSEDKVQLLFDASVAGDEFVIERLLDLGVEVPSDEDSWTDPLHAACFHGHLNSVKLLISKGVDINHRGGGGSTPLMRAGVGGHTEIVRWLLGNGAQGGLRETRDGHPAALAGAASFGNEESFRLIFEAGKFPKPPVQPANIVFWESVLTEEQREGIIMALEQGGSGGSLKLIDTLLAYVPVKNIREYQEMRDALQECMRQAVQTNSPEVVERTLEILISHVWAEGSEEHDGIMDTLLSAVQSDAVEVMKLIRERHSVDVNYLEPPRKTTALYTAVRSKSVEAVRFLLEECRADIHIASGKFANGPTALWLAVEQQHEKLARLVLAHGGPVESIDPAIRQGKTKRVFVSAARSYRAPVRLHAEMEPAWGDPDNPERPRFLCLEYPDEGWPGGVELRRSDEDLRDERETRPREESDFVVV